MKTQQNQLLDIVIEINKNFKILFTILNNDKTTINLAHKQYIKALYQLMLDFEDNLKNANL